MHDATETAAQPTAHANVHAARLRHPLEWLSWLVPLRIDSRCLK